MSAPAVLPLLAVTVLAVLALGYRFYGGFVARRFVLDGSAATPAERLRDGVDFVPTRPAYLLPQHFSAIAAAGPIAGPILACQQWGWLPCIVWIVLGVVFVGAVHDFSTLVASVRHDARSVAELMHLYVGRRAWTAMMAFIWIALVYVVVAFTDVTAATFVSGGTDARGLAFRFNPGGAVAAASALYLALAVTMGVVERRLRPPLWLLTLVFVPATLGAVWLGTRVSTWLVLGPGTWALVILAYCFVSSLLPVRWLLQPRGYLGGFVLYLALAAGVLGIFFGGFTVEQPAWKGWTTPDATGALFPFLFVTVACGACSGFHGLVCSGTTSKQIARETHCRPIGYGAMLLEAFVALVALATIMIASPAEAGGKGPGALYGLGLGRFMAALVGPEHLLFCVTFGAMAFSTFVFDTLDVTTRLGRYLLQELFGWRGRARAALATAITCAVPGALVLASDAGSYRAFWTLFGTSNQLLAALSLLGIAVWLRRTGRSALFVVLPMLFVLAVTLSALAVQVAAATGAGAPAAVRWNGLAALVLLGLAVALLWFALRSPGAAAPTSALPARSRP